MPSSSLNIQQFPHTASFATLQVANRWRRVGSNPPSWDPRCHHWPQQPCVLRGGGMPRRRRVRYFPFPEGPTLAPSFLRFASSGITYRGASITLASHSRIGQTSFCCAFGSNRVMATLPCSSCSFFCSLQARVERTLIFEEEERGLLESIIHTSLYGDRYRT